MTGHHSDGEETQGRAGQELQTQRLGDRISALHHHGKALGYGEPVRVKEGQRVLFHILNGSATENIELALPGHQFQVIALDGNPVPHLNWWRCSHSAPPSGSRLWSR